MLPEPIYPVKNDDQSFAYNTVNKRLPEILTKIIDRMNREANHGILKNIRNHIFSNCFFLNPLSDIN